MSRTARVLSLMALPISVITSGCVSTRQAALHLSPTKVYADAIASRPPRASYSLVPTATIAARIPEPIVLVAFDDRTVAPHGALLDDRGPPNMHLNLVNQIVRTMRTVYARLPASLDRALSLAHPVSGPGLPRQFIIVRQLEDYDWVEQAIIETETGRVLASAIVKRREPVFSSPGSWVLSPYQTSYLGPTAYRHLVLALQSKFDVRFGENLTAARFEGLRDPEAPKL